EYGMESDGVPAAAPSAKDRAAAPVASAPPAAPAAPATGSPRPGLGIERLGTSSAPSQPGLAAASKQGDEAPSEPAEDPGLAEVSMLLGEAQTAFQAGNREAATAALVRAAQAYDNLGRYDSAAAIYRSLGHSEHVSLPLMLLWLKNCQR